jgi:precorrin-6B methylase 2
MEKFKRYLKKSLISFWVVTSLVLLSQAGVQQKKPEVPYVPTPEEVVEEMLKMARVDEEDVLYDLGCGDGRIVITAAKKYGCRGVGIDIDPQRVKESRENAKKEGVSDKVQFYQMDLFEADISEASVVTLYLLSKVNLRLRPKLFKELNPGTRVVSHAFNMGDWEPDASNSVRTSDYWSEYIVDYWDEHTVNYWDFHTVYFWIIPANVSGTWRLKIQDISGSNELTMKFEQEFQRVKGTASNGTSSLHVHIKDGKIKGNLLQFTVGWKRRGRTERMNFEGFVQGNTMRGTLEIAINQGKRKIKWRAMRDVMTLRPIINSNSSSMESFIIRLPLI